MRTWILILLIFPLFANATYQRNQARPVNEVIFGQVETVRYISQQEMIQSKAKGWETLLGAAVGGLVGHQFGDGRGKQVATTVGALTGAVIAHQHGKQSYHYEDKLVEILIRTSKGDLIDVIQDVDSDMLFYSGDKVRILYFDDGVRVDKEK